LIKLLAAQPSNETALSALSLILTVVAGYGVYVAQMVDKKLEAVDAKLLAVEQQLDETKHTSHEMRETVDDHKRELEAALMRARVQSLRQAILAQLPDERDLDPPARAGYALIRGIVKDAIARTNPQQVMYDCDEVLAICTQRNLDAGDLLGKAAEPFYLYHSIAQRAAARDEQISDWV